MIPQVTRESPRGPRGVLALAGLAVLGAQLAESRLWSHVLSPGGQQRLAFACMYLQRPSWVVMDETTTALDEPAEGQLYQALIDGSPPAAVVSVGDRSSLLQHHDWRLVLQGEGRRKLEPVPASVAR